MTVVKSALLGIGIGVFLFTLKVAINIIEPSQKEATEH